MVLQVQLEAGERLLRLGAYLARVDLEGVLLVAPVVEANGGWLSRCGGGSSACARACLRRRRPGISERGDGPFRQALASASHCVQREPRGQDER